MPYYGTIYRLQYTNQEEELVTVDIGDKLTASEAPITITYILMDGGEAAFLPEADDPEEDKFSPIRAKSCTIQFLSSETVNLNTFCEGTDDRFPVDIYTDNQTLFRGFLVLDDMSEEFQDPPNLVTLTATDNIGTLKDIPLTKPDGSNPKGHYKIIEYVAWALQKTGLELNIQVAHNIMEEDYEGLPMWNNIFLDAKTWEAEINESINCYEVLEKILGEDSFITQEGGVWWIRRVDEMNASTMKYWQYNHKGTFLALGSATTYVQEIEQAVQGLGPLEFIQDGALVSPVRAFKKVILNYNYENWKENICNIDFSRGVIISDTPTEKTYTIECWVFEAGTAAGVAGVTPFGTAIIKKIFVDDYEKERFAVVPNFNSGNTMQWIRSENVEVELNDKATVSVDFKLSHNLSGGGDVMFMQVMLVGVSITYTYGRSVLLSEGWHVYDPVSLDQPFIKTSWNKGDTDERIYQTLSGNLGAMPASGNLHVKLFSWGASAGTRYEVHYTNLQLTYNPYINGSYQTFRAQQHIVTNSNDGYKAVRDEVVYISDSPRKLFKGALKKLATGSVILTDNTDFFAGNGFLLPSDRTAMFYAGRIIRVAFTLLNDGNYTVVSSSYNGGTNFTTVTVVENTVLENDIGATFYSDTYQLAGRFYDGLAITGTPADADLHPYGWHQVQAVWNQYNRTFRNFEFTAQGLKTDTNRVPDMIYRYLINDSSDHSDNKQFMLLHMSQDHVTCEWEGFLAEVFDSTIPKVYDSPYEFKYITER